MINLTGKGMFIWIINQCEGGNLEKIATLAREGNFSHVLIKIADGAFPYNIDKNTNADLAAQLIQKLHARNIPVFGWHYVYGGYPQQEADIAIKRVKELGVDGYVINAEGEYSNKHSVAEYFCRLIRQNISGIPICLSSYRYPNVHASFPWDVFLRNVEINMPQVYWMKSHNAGEQLRKSYSQFMAMPHRPLYFPTGAAFKEFGWRPTPQEVQEFFMTAKSLDLKGCNFYVWDFASKYLPEIWETVRNLDWQNASLAKGLAERYMELLNTHDPLLLAALYMENAVRIHPGGIQSGITAIHNWYTYFLTKVCPNGKFLLLDANQQANRIQLKWQAVSDNGAIIDGSDTLGLDAKGLIIYHYSFFTPPPGIPPFSAV